VAVDGKTLRGSGTAGEQMHLLAALDHSGAVLAQVQVNGKSNEISAFQPLLDQVDLTATVVTSDCLCRARHKASYVDPIVMPTGVGNCPRWWEWAARVVRHNRGILIL
jgi:hypothetical protein